MPLESLDAIRGSLRSAEGLPPASTLAAVGSLLLLVSLICLYLVHLRNRRRLAASWRQFSTAAAKRGLNGDETELLRKFANREDSQRPLSVIESLAAFERGVHRYLTPLARHGRDPERVRAAVALVESLRSLLDFPASGGSARYGTRQLPDGQRVYMTPLRSAAACVWGCVTGSREDFLQIAELGSDAAHLRGRRVEAVAFDRAGAVTFEATVTDVEGSSCLLTHSVDVRETDARYFHRVSANAAITFRAVWEPDEVRREAVLRDLSGGGLALLGRCFYEPGERVFVDLSPADLLGPHHKGADDPLQGRQIDGRIVETRQVSKEQCVYHVHFDDMDGPARQYVFALIRRIELGRRRADAAE